MDFDAKSLDKNKIISLLNLNENDAEKLFLHADEITNRLYKGVEIRAIIEFSNYCKRNCLYCGINCKSNVERYRMSKDEIISLAEEARDAGFKTVILQSGEDVFYEEKAIVEIIKEIKELEIALTLSIGERPFGELKTFKEAGADRYLLKHETSDEALYKKLHPDAEIKDRIATLKHLKELGYETGSGFMIGLPNQTIDSIADDILLLKEIGCDMAGIGPYLQSSRTALKNSPQGNAFLVSKAVAITRILMGKINLPSTTSLSVLDKAARNRLYLCGANVLMRSITPQKYKKLYDIYDAEFEEKTPEEIYSETVDIIKSIGKIAI